MRRSVVNMLAYAFVLLALVFLFEGLFSVLRWSRVDRSIVYDTYRMLVAEPADVETPSGLRVATRDEIEALIPDMKAAGVGMGNVPYKSELMNDSVAINERGEDGCLSPKPGIRKYTTYIRSGDFDRFDPPSLFYDRDAELPDSVRDFVTTYSVHLSEFTSNENRERLTFPQVESERKILVAGDSIAVGTMLDDSDTIASQLQQRNSAAQYVNIGVNGASAADAICRLKATAERYNGQIVRIIYVYSEGDFESGTPYGTPEEVVGWLQDFAKQNNIPAVTIVFGAYIYNIIPHLTRFDGSRGARWGQFFEESTRLKELSLAAGLDYVSIGDVAMEEARIRQTDLAVFALFVDHAHLSKYGVSRLIEQLPVD